MSPDPISQESQTKAITSVAALTLVEEGKLSLSLVSTARDYGRFLEMIRGDGTLDGVRILLPRTVALVRTNQMGTLHSTNGLGFGLGFETPTGMERTAWTMSGRNHRRSIEL